MKHLPLWAAWCLVSAALLHHPQTASAQGTAFTYQGRLNNAGGVANGLYDFQFTVFGANLAGNPTAGPVTNTAVTVSNGLFTTAIDFGANPTGNRAWLELAVSTNGANNYTTLTPRQQLLPTPYAMFANTASNLAGVVSAGQLSGTVANGNLPASPTFGGTLTAGALAGNGANVTNVNAAGLNGLSATNFWQLGGNNVAAGQFLGSLDNQPVEFWVNTNRALRLEYAYDNNNHGVAPNVIGGSAGNVVSNGYVGSVIGGGGNSVSPNRLGANYSAILGGMFNNVSGDYALVGGYGNAVAAGGAQSIALGWYNTANTLGGVLLGGGNQSPSGQYGVALGNGNISGGFESTAIGYHNSASGTGAAAIGYANNASGSAALALGYITVASGDYSAALGNQAHAVNTSSFVWSDSSSGLIFGSTGNNQFLIRAQGGVAINTNNPSGAALHVVGNVLVDGATNFTVNALQVAVGQGASANGSTTIALGTGAQSTNASSSALGYQATASGSQSTAIGASTFALGLGATAVGSATHATSDDSTAIGYSCFANAPGTVAMGIADNATANYATALGQSSSATANYALALGFVANAGGYGSLALGWGANAPAGNAMAMGNSAGASATNAIAVGNSANVSGDDSVAIGSYAQAGPGYGNYGRGVAVGDSANTTGEGVANGFDAKAADGSVAVGPQAQAFGLASIALGLLATTTNDYSMALGYRAYANDTNVTVVGAFASADGNGGCALGNNSSADDVYGTALGASAWANGADSTALGGGAVAYAGQSTAVGDNAYADQQSVAVGQNSYAYGGTAVGYSAYADPNAVALGDNSVAALFAVALGSGARATNQNSIAIGTGARTMADNSMAFGEYSRAATPGAMVFSDHAGGLFFSAFSNEFAVRATGGVRLVTAVDGIGVPTSGAFLPAGGTAWATISDQNAKKNFTAVSGAEILNKLAAVPVEKWNYRWEANTSTPHIGPMAQAFKAAFYPGCDDKSITTLEFDGVELAAIQGLNEKVDSGRQATETQIQKLTAENAQLKQSVAELKALVLALAAKK